MRSIPTQFWPAEMKTPRRRMDAISKSLLDVRTSSRIIAGSLPPSSTHTGVRLFAADVQTAWATGREPMNVICAIEGWEIRWSAVKGQHTMGWTRLGECPHAERALRAMETIGASDQAVCSDAFMTIAEPVKRVDIIGPMTL